MKPRSLQGGIPASHSILPGGFFWSRRAIPYV